MKRDGFLLLPNAFSAEEVAVFPPEVERLRSDKGILASDAAIREPDSGALRSLFAIHQSSELFAKVAADERIAAKVQHLLDGDLYVHQSRLNLKPGFKGKEFYWHSDFETWHAEDGLPRMRTISCSILLTDNHPATARYCWCRVHTATSSAAWVKRQTSTTAAHCASKSLGVPDEASLAAMVSEGGITAATGQAGSVVLFDCNTLHGSNSNITPDPRSKPVLRVQPRG
ncbi:phytanoyl-CoA dioxygenase family protein [Halopseudomonas pachastrellae]|nr:phytanoyl-CoA dioxygenase family protein [Halopseudomonas pachastrellae]